MVLASQFAPICGIWAGFCATPGGAHRCTIHECPIPIDLLRCLEVRKPRFEDALPNTCFVPLLKMAPAGFATGKIAGRRKPTPGNARPEDEEDTGKHLARLRRFSARKLHMPVLLWLRDQRFQTLPEIIRQN